MGVHLTYSEIDDHPITEKEARKVYRILEESGAASGWLGYITKQWGAGEDLRELVRNVIKAAYREHEKRLYFAGFPINPKLRELQLDMYAAVGIEPPGPPDRTIGHGS